MALGPQPSALPARLKRRRCGERRERRVRPQSAAAGRICTSVLMKLVGMALALVGSGKEAGVPEARFRSTPLN